MCIIPAAPITNRRQRRYGTQGLRWRGFAIVPNPVPGIHHPESPAKYDVYYIRGTDYKSAPAAVRGTGLTLARICNPCQIRFPVFSIPNPPAKYNVYFIRGTDYKSAPAAVRGTGLTLARICNPCQIRFPVFSIPNPKQNIMCILSGHRLQIGASGSTGHRLQIGASGALRVNI
jgi:hypothetical protein